MSADLEEKMEDKVLEAELVLNERVIEHPKLGKVKLIRPSPRIESLIAEERRKIWHKDLKDSNILSRKQVAKMLEERGVWSESDDDRITELTGMSGDLMLRLTALGFVSVRHLALEIEDVQDSLIAAAPDNDEVKNTVEGIFDLTQEVTNKHWLLLRKHSTGTKMDEEIVKAESLRGQLTLLERMSEVRTELNILLKDQTDFFSSTIEARADAAERVANIYYCTCNPETGKPLWKSVDKVWDEDGTVLTWLQTQMFYFKNGITPEYARVLEEHGFFQRGISTENELEDSQDPTPSNSDGESPEKQ